MTGDTAQAARQHARDVADRVAAAVRGVDGLALQVPLRTKALRLARSEATLGVTVEPDGIEVRLVAQRLPLPPLLDRAGVAVRAALAGSDWEHRPLRLVVAELAAAAIGSR